MRFALFTEEIKLKFLTTKAYSPYAAGIIIGLLQVPIFLTLHASLGTSGVFNSVACALTSWFGTTDPTMTTGSCFTLLKQWWQLGFVIGIALGAYLSSRWSNTRRTGYSPIWHQLTNIRSLGKRSLMAFSGGFIALIGARIADGCTSGNGISGIALLSIGSMIVIASMFISGIIAVRLYKNS